MSQMECPDCEGPETVFSFPPRGIGKCSGCRGTGESYMGLPAVLVGGVECDKCNGNGVCSTCQGEGVIEESDEE